MTLRAPAKLNLCLYLGRPRGDGLHELRSLFCPLTLSDRIMVLRDRAKAGELPPGADEDAVYSMIAQADPGHHLAPSAGS